jgi:hypothetical protein
MMPNFWKYNNGENSIFGVDVAQCMQESTGDGTQLSSTQTQRPLLLRRYGDTVASKVNLADCTNGAVLPRPQQSRRRPQPPPHARMKLIAALPVYILQLMPKSKRADPAPSLSLTYENLKRLQQLLSPATQPASMPPRSQPASPTRTANTLDAREKTRPIPHPRRYWCAPACRVGCAC